MPGSLVAPDRSPQIDALRLLRLVRIRRELRLTWHTMALAVVGWPALVLAVQALVPDDSPLQDLGDAVALPGFVVIGVLLSICLALLVGLRFTGAAGLAAANIVPIARRPPELTPEAGTGAILALLPVLRRRGLVSFRLLMLLIGAGLAFAGTVVNAVPAHQANSGSGGDRIVVGQDTTLDHTTTSRRGVVSYYLDTPVGVVLFEGSEPRAGEEWSVIDNPITGGLQAYRVGGHDWVLVAMLSLVFGIATAVLLVLCIGSAIGEIHRRRRANHVPLAESVAALTSGPGGQLRIGNHGTVLIGMAPLRPGDSPAALLHRRRRSVVALAGSVVGLACVGLVLAATGAFSPAATERSTTLGYLSGTGWQSAADISYDHPGDEADLLSSGGGLSASSLGAGWSVLIDGDAQPNGEPSSLSATIEVQQLTAVPPEAAVAAAFAAWNSRSGPASNALTGLPAGWRGRTLVEGSTRRADVVSAVDGTLLSIKVLGDVGEADFAARVQSLAVALGKHGLGVFRDDTGPT